MTSTISSSSNGIFDTNYDNAENLNILGLISSNHKMINKTTSMSSLSAFPHHDYLHNKHAARPSIEFVKSFLNRFLNDLAGDQSSDSSKNMNCQSNTNFVNFDSMFHYSDPNKYFRRNDYDDKYQNLNKLVNELYSLTDGFMSENVVIENTTTLPTESLNQLLEDSVNKLFMVILNYEIKKISKKQWKILKKSHHFDKNYELKKEMFPTEAEAEVIFYEEISKMSETPNDTGKITVNVDENSFRSINNPSVDTIQKTPLIIEKKSINKSQNATLLVPKIVFKEPQYMQSFNLVGRQNFNANSTLDRQIPRPKDSTRYLESSTQANHIKSELKTHTTTHACKKFIQKSTCLIGRLFKSKSQVKSQNCSDLGHLKLFGSSLIRKPDIFIRQTPIFTNKTTQSDLMADNSNSSMKSSVRSSPVPLICQTNDTNCTPTLSIKSKSNLNIQNRHNCNYDEISVEFSN